jgi:hypothetical protein
VGGAPETVFLRHRRHDGGEFYHDLCDDTLDVTFATNPLGHLLIGEIMDGRCERVSGGITERFGTGDVLLLAEPHLPHVCRIPAARINLIGISLQAVAQVTPPTRPSPPSPTGGASTAPAGSLPSTSRLTAYRPATHCTRTTRPDPSIPPGCSRWTFRSNATG